MVHVDELEKKAVEELKKVEAIAEDALVKAVDGREFHCWGWKVRISRIPKTQTPPKSEEKPASTEASPSAPASV